MGWAKDRGSQAQRKRAGQVKHWRVRGRAIALLCAVVLGIIPGVLVAGQPAHAATQTTFYGVADMATLNAATTATTATVAPTSAATTAPAATATDTPTVAATATDTPAAATATPAPAATATSTPAPTATPVPTATPGSLPTPTSTSNKVLDITQALNATGQQSGGNWCGIATITLIANYVHAASPMSQNTFGYGILSDSSATSEWGTPPNNGYGPGVTADISQDFGTDPRSLAYGLTAGTGYRYHVVVDTGDAWDATIHIIRAMMESQQPISVFVDHGQHSIIVYGVDATGDPLANPGSITAIHVWDPGTVAGGSAIQSTPQETVPLSRWLNGYTDWGGSDYLKFPYAGNQDGALQLDPDPSVGPYTFVPSLYNHLWIGHYVFVSPFGPNANSDWAENQNGALIAGEASSGWPATPAGYTGAVVQMPTNPPPPPPPVQVFSSKPLPPPKPKPVPKPTPTPKPTATPPPTPRPRRTAMPVGTPIATPLGTPTAATQGACILGGCDSSSMAPIWALSLLGALLIGGVLFTVGAIAPRRRLAWLAALGASDQAAVHTPFTPIPAGPDEQTLPDVHAALRGEHPDSHTD
ncbi:MAG TPA: hypothetical protein VF792_02745 [Ktedonobacterales bacterium]